MLQINLAASALRLVRGRPWLLPAGRGANRLPWRRATTPNDPSRRLTQICPRFAHPRSDSI